MRILHLLIGVYLVILFARAMYLSLYKMHEVAVHGWWKTALGSASRMITRSTEPRVKLH